MHIHTSKQKLVTGAVALLIAGFTFPAVAQHARSYVIDASAAAGIASARASSAARPGAEVSLAEQLIKEGATVRENGSRTDVYIPSDVRSCASSLSIGSPTVDKLRPGESVNIRVIMLGSTIQSDAC